MSSRAFFIWFSVLCATSALAGFMAVYHLVGRLPHEIHWPLVACAAGRLLAL